jgi:hypothetical protein
MGKKIIILTTVTLVLALFLWANREDTDRAKSLLFQKLDASKVASITIDHFTNGIQLKKTSDGWTVAPYETELAKKIAAEESKGVARDNLTETAPPAAAEPATVEQALDVFTLLPSEPVIASNPEKHGLFEITDAATRVTLWSAQSEKLAALYIGKQGPTPFSSYVRKEGRTDVLIANQDLGMLFKRPIDEWKRK